MRKKNIDLAREFGTHVANTQGVEALHDLAHGGRFRYLMSVWIIKSGIESRNAHKATMDALLFFNPGYWAE